MILFFIKKIKKIFKINLLKSCLGLDKSIKSVKFLKIKFLNWFKIKLKLNFKSVG